MKKATLNSARKKVAKLIERFGRNLASYRDPSYNEAQLRKEFLDPFFEALGWDVYNKGGAAPQYKEVIDEATLRSGGTTKAPDYSFRFGQTRKFFVEAKKPAVTVKDNPDAAYQLRRYAWSAKLPLSILTDFEEFAVYESRRKPARTDKASVERINFLTYDEYPERLEEIWNVFSKDAILKGDFDRYAVSARKKRGTAEVDGEFLREIEGWRDVLARNIALRNPDLSVHDLNSAVQTTIDRILFFRIAEDRGVEDYGRIHALLNGANIYARLTELYYEADDKYNAGLFDFSSDGDTLTPNLAIDDKVLKDIIGGLYYPDCPYEFSVISADILGSVYERFLGKVIRLTPGHRAKVEDKPEVKKAGGVYYTPTFIVDYIVKNTIGKWIEGKSPKQIEKLKILDPACGSGSFLLATYQMLLDHHLQWYTDHPPRKRLKPIYQVPVDAEGRPSFRLTTQEKKRIILNNIFGVDIDPQAVEVTKLNLLLKVLEGETEETVSRTRKLFHERALPNLDENIKCGNSLIGPDYWKGKSAEVFGDDEERRRINAFDWEAKFPDIMKRGGFDVVIGNPPYMNIDDVWGKGDSRQRYIKKVYSDVYRDKTDILFYFLAKAVQLTRGDVAFIVSRAFLEAYKADKLRGWLASECDINEIIDFQNFPVFQGVGITTAVLILSKAKRVRNANVYKLAPDAFLPDDLGVQKSRRSLFLLTTAEQKAFTSASWVFAEETAEAVISKLDAAGMPLGEVLLVGQGMQTGRNSVFGRLDTAQLKRWGLKKERYFKRARNSHILRYYLHKTSESLLYIEDVQRFNNLPLGVQAHLKTHERELKARAAYKRRDCEWWKYTWPLHQEHIRRARLYCPYIAADNRFALDEKAEYLGLTDTTVLFDAGQLEQLRYLLGLLNSKLLSFRFRYIGKLKSGGLREYFWNSICKLPIRRINFADSTDKSHHDALVELVDRMLELHKKLHNARTKHGKELIQRQIDATDSEIDQLVYELYELTPEEIKVVEGGY